MVAFAEATLDGRQDDIGSFGAEGAASVYGALSMNFRAAAEYMHRNSDEIWERAQYPSGIPGMNEAFSSFIKAGTVNAQSIYNKLRLYDEAQENYAEQNAAHLINRVGELDEPGFFSDPLRMTFADIAENYWDDLVYSYNSPGGVSENPHRGGIEVDPDYWHSFVTEGMRNPDAAGQLHGVLVNWYQEGIKNQAGAQNGNEHYWDNIMANNLAGMFSSSWDTVLDEIEEDKRRREEFIEELSDRGVDFATDPTEAAGDVVKEIIKAAIASAITATVGGDSPPDLDFDFAGAHLNWVRVAVAEYNAGSIDDYHDGTVERSADPEYYGNRYGASFTDENGNVIAPLVYNEEERKIVPNEDFPDDPRALEAFNAWVQSKPVQVYMGEEQHSRF
ncbi:hypothetical protein EF847_05410 [Actinobacteria bacterium YIM 96077]|uniref:Uncharacterized protein n=1 Tax=Phytoactinopolyspora halophila TaxID=1981511 RepID=A0A329R3E5_9ACTN|nr:hypothetical protein [Phytoactinopolyspora halophila]AYY12228.1 hypothetical protein EF847_05410 [Actinobacteria bacterium YIM 96077]RAW18539.1 hypothetical protein DPM12_00105 [Phytoactinopolyspora halophila]